MMSWKNLLGPDITIIILLASKCFISFCKTDYMHGITSLSLSKMIQSNWIYWAFWRIFILIHDSWCNFWRLLAISQFNCNPYPDLSPSYFYFSISKVYPKTYKYSFHEDLSSALKVRWFQNNYFCLRKNSGC